MSVERVATTPVELQEALQSGATDIEVRGELTGMPMVTLPPGVRLRGGTLRFGAKGVRLTRDKRAGGRYGCDRAGRGGDSQ
jgi:hypothetical protein